MQIKLVTQADREKWDGFLDKFPDIPPMNRYVWNDILKDSYGVRTYFFIALDDNGDVVGILPAYITRDIRRRMNLYSLRFGLVAGNKDCCAELLDHIKRFCEKNKIMSCSITTGYDSIDAGYAEIVKKTIVLNISGSEEATWQSLRDKTRNMIRKSIKSGLTTERGPENIKVFYDIYAENMLEKGIPIHRLDFFKSIFQKMGNNAELITVKSGGNIIGGMLVLYSAGAAIYPFQASLAGFRSHAPNQFLVWEAVRSCIKRCIPALDMGESSEGSNVYDFKVNFGGVPRDVYYYSTFLRNGEQSENGGIRKAGQSFAVRALSAAPFFMRKPLGLWLKPQGRII